MKTTVLATSLLVIIGVGVYLNGGFAPSEPAAAVAPIDTRDIARSEAARSFLIEYFGPDAENLRVVVDGKAASISGEVFERPTKELADEVVRSSVDGVLVVHNFVTYVDVEGAGDLMTLAELEEQDAILETKVLSGLASEVGEAARSVSVEACDGVVSLEGGLPDIQYHDEVLQTARAMPEVSRVIDLLEVTS